MQKTIFLFALLTAGLFTKAQTAGTARLYAYRQSILPGVQPGGAITESGERIEAKPTSNAQYIIYITATGRVYPVALWIKGERFAVNTEAIRKTPVIVFQDEERGNPQKKILVPKTTQKVWLLTPLPITDNLRFPQAEAAARKADVVVVYKMNGRFYYKTVNRIESVPAATAE